MTAQAKRRTYISTTACLRISQYCLQVPPNKSMLLAFSKNKTCVPRTAASRLRHRGRRRDKYAAIQSATATAASIADRPFQSENGRFVALGEQEGAFACRRFQKVQICVLSLLCLVSMTCYRIQGTTREGCSRSKALSTIPLALLLLADSLCILLVVPKHAGSLSNSVITHPRP